MFLGHAAAAFAAKKVAPKTSLGTLFMAAQFIDLLWPIFLLAGLEHVRIDPGNTALTPLDFYDYPISHSLLGVSLWGLAFGAVYYAARRHRAGAIVLCALVLSHWALDFLVHSPDLPLLPGSDARVGLGLWNSVPATLIVEGALFASGVALYARTTRAADRTGRYALWTLVGFLVAIYAMNVAAGAPPSSDAIAIAGNASWLFVLWGYWIDRHRTVSDPPPAGALRR